MSAASEPSASPQLRISRGSFYLDCALCALYLPDIEAIAPLQRDGAVYLMPLLGTGGGGLLLKRRNARGDRVVHAQEFLQSLGIEPDDPERIVIVRWVSEMGGLLLTGLAVRAADQPTKM